tara:strand:+ start:216 stop:479 length:264 start_codon:yes stop_codon:yes gene_type:complete
MPFWAFILSRFTLNFPQILTSPQKQTLLYFFLLYFFMNQKEIQEKINLVMSDPRFFGNRLSAYEVVKEVYDLSEDHSDIFGNSTPKL